MTEAQNKILVSYVKKNNKLIEDIAELGRLINEASSYDEDNFYRKKLLDEIIKHRSKHITEVLVKEAYILLEQLKQNLESISLLQILSDAEKIQ